MPEERDTSAFRPISVFEDVVPIDLIGLYDASYKVSIAVTVADVGLLILAHIR